MTGKKGIARKQTVHSITKLVVVFIVFANANTSAGLEVRKASNGYSYIAHDGHPVFGYGASPQNILTYLPRGQGNDYQDWVTWARKYSINHVRSYPPSIIVSPPAINLYQHASEQPEKFDLSQLNDAYFKELRKACKLFADNGIFVHLQLWQAVYWKRYWQENYFNPENNINPEISRNAGPGEFMAMGNPALLAHQKKYLSKVLDTVADLGNVYLDIANEIGNGTASSLEWALEMLATVRQWEDTHNREVLVTINDEGGIRVQGVKKLFNRSNLIIKDLGRWDEHVEAQQKFGKPTVSVRNIDWDYQKQQRHYFYGEDNLEINEDPLLQIRGRKYWWRMYMARVQMAGAYADAYDKIGQLPGATLVEKALNKVGAKSLMPTYMAPSYRRNTLTEDNFRHFRNFVDQIINYENLIPSTNVVTKHPAAHVYVLHSKEQAIIYLESPNGNAGHSYAPSPIKLENLLLTTGNYRGQFYDPSSGNQQAFEIPVEDGIAELSAPSFQDDLAIIIQ